MKICVLLSVQLSRLYVFPLSAWCTGAGDDAQILDELGSMEKWQGNEFVACFVKGFGFVLGF